MKTLTINGYSITYSVSESGGITLNEVVKKNRDITEKMDVTLRAKLVSEAYEAEQSTLEGLEWEAMQEMYDRNKQDEWDAMQEKLTEIEN